MAEDRQGPRPAEGVHAVLRPLAAGLATSALLAEGRRLWELNRQDLLVPLDRSQKLMVGAYLMIHDYARGRLRLRRETMEEAHRAEQDWRFSCPGLTEEQVSRRGLRKPFSFDSEGQAALMHLVRLAQALQRCGVKPPQRLLELGCGHGWLAEALAIMGFDVCATTLSPREVEVSRGRVDAIRAKGLDAALEYREASMESVHEAVGDRAPFDAAFVYEALHHVYDWRRALRSAHACLAAGGWLLLCNEPNVLHPLVSYRMARLLGVQELGFRRGELVRQLRAAGFREILNLSRRRPLSPHWIAARR